MLQDQISIFADLYIELQEIGATVVCIDVASERVLGGATVAPTVRDHQRTIRAIEIGGFGHKPVGKLGEQGDCKSLEHNLI